MRYTFEFGELHEDIKGAMARGIAMSKMKWLVSLALALCIANASPIEIEDHALDKRTTPYGIDVSSYQGNVNWSQVKANGISFAYIKATEGTCKI
jgi:hypothetical protein